MQATAKDINEADRDMDVFFAWLHRESDSKREDMRLLIKATLDTGGTVREIWGESFTDWNFYDRKAAGWGFEDVDALVAHLLNRYVGFRTELQFDPVIQCIPFTADEAVKDALAAGYTHVRTFGGLVPLQEWKPYGHSTGFSPSYRTAWEFDRERGAIRDVPEEITPGFLIGLWILEPVREVSA